MNWIEIKNLASDFGTGVNILGAVVLLCRIVVKISPNPKTPGRYMNIIKILRHGGLVLGDIEEHI